MQSQSKCSKPKLLWSCFSPSPGAISRAHGNCYTADRRLRRLFHQLAGLRELKLKVLPTSQSSLPSKLLKIVSEGDSDLDSAVDGMSLPKRAVAASAAIAGVAASLRAYFSAHASSNARKHQASCMVLCQLNKIRCSKSFLRPFSPRRCQEQAICQFRRPSCHSHRQAAKRARSLCGARAKVERGFAYRRKARCS